MSAIRRFASRLLKVMVRCSSPDSRNWGNAMLREMDFAESDWNALLWALGSTTALCRHSASGQLKAWFHIEALSVKSIAKMMPAMLLGIAVAGAVLTVCVIALSSLVHASWFHPEHVRLADRLLVVIVPETLYVAGAGALWRQKKSVSLGILAAGVILITHAIIHFATHG